MGPDPHSTTRVRWTAARFFNELGSLGRVRVISVSGASVFEAIIRIASFEIASGHLNIICDDYHWHLRLQGFGYLRSHDETHARSGRRVLYFELAEAAGEAPFLRIYLYRPPKADFDAGALARFGKLHEQLADGVSIAEDSP